MQQHSARKYSNRDVGRLRFPSASGTDPGLIVSKEKRPWASVPQRPNALNPMLERARASWGSENCPFRVGLPYLEHAVLHRQSVAIEHCAFDANSFTGDVRHNQIVGEPIVPGIVAVRRQSVFEIGTEGLRRRKVAVMKSLTSSSPAA